ncbi:MAG: histidine kinase, partial [Acidobacteriota bacterium]
MVPVLESHLAGRRNIARYLHDTICQDLVVLALSLARSQRDLNSNPASAPGLGRALELIDRCSSDLRVLNAVLAPPLVDQMAAKPALDWYVELLRMDANLDVQFEYVTTPGGGITPDPLTRTILLAAVQTWAERAVGRQVATGTLLRLTAGPHGFEFEFLSGQAGDPAVEAVLTCPLLLTDLRRIGGQMAIVPDHSGSSARLTFCGTAEL